MKLKRIDFDYKSADALQINEKDRLKKKNDTKYSKMVTFQRNSTTNVGRGNLFNIASQK